MCEQLDITLSSWFPHVIVEWRQHRTLQMTLLLNVVRFLLAKSRRWCKHPLRWPQASFHQLRCGSTRLPGHIPPTSSSSDIWNDVGCTSALAAVEFRSVHPFHDLSLKLRRERWWKVSARVMRTVCRSRAELALPSTSDMMLVAKV